MAYKFSHRDLQWSSCLHSNSWVSVHTPMATPPFLGIEQVFFERRKTVLISHWMCVLHHIRMSVSPSSAETETDFYAPCAALPNPPQGENRTLRRKQLLVTAVKRHTWKPRFSLWWYGWRESARGTLNSSKTEKTQTNFCFSRARAGSQAVTPP